MRRALMTVVVLSVAAAASLAVAGQSATTDLASRIDVIVEAPIREGKVAGTAVAVVKGGTTILAKGYGKADLEWDIPMPADATFEIGSVTKQFTAAALLLLRDEGKLSLDDEITKYLPTYPTQGQRIQLRRLLNHTSGIKGYTEIEEFGDFMRLDKPKDALVALFSAKPFDFPAGDEQIYNNSAFFLLGLVIEKASGQSYQSFVQQRLFDRVGMPNSYYCSERTLVKRHAHGYDVQDGRFVQKGFIDHDWPYAAGSLCSNTTDLVAWNRALHGGKVLSAASYKEMTSAGLLNDGTPIRYGYGISVADLGNRRVIGHGGGINGFLSESQYYPEDDLIVIVLQNTNGAPNPRDTAKKIAEAVLGPAPNRAKPFSGDASSYAGTYGGRGRGRPTTVTIAANGSGLSLARVGAPGGKPEPLEYRGSDTFALGDTLVMFERRDGKVTRLRLDSGSGHNVLARQ